jgi:hypothetical protein
MFVSLCLLAVLCIRKFSQAGSLGRKEEACSAKIVMW